MNPLLALRLTGYGYENTSTSPSCLGSNKVIYICLDLHVQSDLSVVRLTLQDFSEFDGTVSLEL